MGIPLLVLCLEGPLQSWGERSRWIYRDTASMPTKSGIIGLLSCAMGLSRNDPKIAQLDTALTMGSRADKIGTTITDFHTIKGVIHTADNNKITAENKKTIITYRDYLQDALFMVVLEGEKNLLQECEKALNNPKWVISLGRKSCVPSRPVLEKYTEEYSSIKDFLNKFPAFEDDQNDKKILCEIENKNGLKERQDRYQNNPARMYGYRKVDCFSISLPQRQSVEENI